MNGTISVKELTENPVIQQLLENLDSKDLESEVKIPYVIKDRILMSPGKWNGFFYSPSSIKMAYEQTNFEDKETRSLFLDHADRAAREWIGEVKNVRIRGDDAIGDLIVVDKATAVKLYYGAKFGISPKVHGVEDGGAMQNFTFDNFSVVINPAVKTA